MIKTEIYDAVRDVPETAKKTIGAGRLKGMTDINPQWRIQELTKQFGACGFGWFYDIDKQWIEEVGEERVAFANIKLYVKVNDEWSKPISGTGGSKLATMERSGLYVSDECFKMAITDAISVACKQLGFGADVYWSAGRTKYSPVTNEQKEEAEDSQKTEDIKQMNISEIKVHSILNKALADGVDVIKLCKMYGVVQLKDLNEEQYRDICNNWSKKIVVDCK